MQDDPEQRDCREPKFRGGFFLSFLMCWVRSKWHDDRCPPLTPTLRQLQGETRLWKPFVILKLPCVLDNLLSIMASAMAVKASIQALHTNIYWEVCRWCTTKLQEVCKRCLAHSERGWNSEADGQVFPRVGMHGLKTQRWILTWTRLLCLELAFVTVCACVPLQSQKQVPNQALWGKGGGVGWPHTTSVSSVNSLLLKAQSPWWNRATLMAGSIFFWERRPPSVLYNLARRFKNRAVASHVLHFDFEFFFFFLLWFPKRISAVYKAWLFIVTVLRSFD